jgi:hypothetical protein
VLLFDSRRTLHLSCILCFISPCSQGLLSSNSNGWVQLVGLATALLQVSDSVPLEHKHSWLVHSCFPSVFLLADARLCTLEFVLDTGPELCFCVVYACTVRLHVG